MSLFRNINYSKLSFEALRGYFSVNKAGKLSVIYKFLLACLYPLQTAWNTFETYRAKTWLISQCGWEIGQLTNLLNYLYDNANFVAGTFSISITQAVSGQIFYKTFAYEAGKYEPKFAYTSTTYQPRFNDIYFSPVMTINIPTAIYSIPATLDDIISTLEKIRPLGIKYSIIAV